MIVIRKQFSNLHDSIKEGISDWLGEKNPRLHDLVEQKRESSKIDKPDVDDDPRNARVKVRRRDKQPLHFKTPEIKFASPYDPPKSYQNWHGEAKKYYDGNNYYKQPQEDTDWENEEYEED